MKINHHPLFGTARVEQLYTEKDGVAVKYVCTSATNEHATMAVDIFYRETPHPQFGNHYFGLYKNPYSYNAQIMITNADLIETLEFGMLEGPTGWEYSQHRHDYRTVGDCAVDGGRSYFKRAGDLSVPAKFMKVVDGEFVEDTR
tara:strand:- start:170 stop:601 length:432 start_codon:yes stop_codon:yes gene_type:complete